MRSVIFSFALVAAFAISSSAPAMEGRLEAGDGEFRLRLEGGQVLERDALVGARVIIASGARHIHVVIDAVQEEQTASGGNVVLYRLLIEEPDHHTMHNLCQPDAHGRQLGFPMPAENGFAFTCTSGAEGKCVLMGYRPWDKRSDAPMGDLHAACIRMVRADYGGDGHPTTRDGTVIDVYDRFGIQKPEAADPMPFEAAWGPEGAVCVAHARIAQNITLEMLEQRYSKLRNQLGPEACQEEVIRGNPRALIFNRSALTPP